MEMIEFYKLKDPFGDFSNFSRHSFSYNNKEWKTSEHCYQAMKYENEEIIEKIRNCETPRKAADLGRDPDNGYQIRENWEDMKVSIMRNIVLAKFSQNQCLIDLLLSTGESVIVEHTEKDKFWGDGGDGCGKNMLGKVLMTVRKMLN